MKLPPKKTESNLFSKCLAELIGTWVLVFCGTGAIIVGDTISSDISHLGVSVTFGLAIMVMIFSFGEISGAHFNPAVSIAFFFARRFPFKYLFPYISSQILGALLGSALLKIIFPHHPNLGATIPLNIDLLENNLLGSIGTSFLLEVILAFFLMSVILHVSTGSKEIGSLAGIAIGGVVLLGAFFGGPISGASMNPARSIAPALLSQGYNYLGIYIIAPIMGTCLAVLACKFTKGKSCCHV